jgi:filamentous hemagglutinin
LGLKNSFELLTGRSALDPTRELSTTERLFSGVAVVATTLPAATKVLSNGNTAFMNAAESSGANVTRALTQEEQVASAAQQASRAEQQVAGAAQASRAEQQIAGGAQQSTGTEQQIAGSMRQEQGAVSAAGQSSTPAGGVAPQVASGIPTPQGTMYNGLTGPGPLGEKVANTFRSGTYTEITTSQPTVLYRVYGGGAGQIGPYWTRTPPTGPVQSIIDSALARVWGNTATQVVTIEVPAGVNIYEGAAAAQGGLVGGGSQVFVPNVDLSWIK